VITNTVVNHRKPGPLTWRLGLFGAALAVLLLFSGGVNRVYGAAGKDDGASAGNATRSENDKPGAKAPDSKDNSDTAKDSKAAGSAAASTPASMEDQVRQLNEKMKALEGFIVEQQKKADEKVSKLEQLIEQQQKLMESLQTQAKGGTVAPAGVVAGEPKLSLPDGSAVAAAGVSAGSAGQPSSVAGSAGVPAAGPVVKNASAKAGAQDEEVSPLTLKIGSAYITPVGFADFMLYYRSTDVGSGLSTNFGSIPFSNTQQGQLSELRPSAQASRFGVQFDEMVKGAHVIGYFETDFLGFAPVNSPVTTNSYSQRIRLAWVDVRKGKWEVLGGQSWSLLTPDRNSLSPMPNDIYYPHLDPGNQVGLTWSRDPQIRFVYHASDAITFGVSAEQAEQYIGGSSGAGAVTLPSALASAYGTELDNGATTLTTPNVAPDFIAKLAFDPKVAGRHFHFEVAGLERNFKVYNPLSQKTYTATGGGGSVNLCLHLLDNVRLMSDNFYSDGGGRFVFGLEPDLVIRGDGSISLVRTYSTIQGVEVQASPNTLLYGYYGGVYAAKNVQVDPVTNALVGFGFPGSSTSQNRAIQEPTFGLSRTFWKDPKYGQLQFNVQYSYVTRSPWIAPTKGPTTASTNMVFLDIRFILPGAPPKLPYSYANSYSY
jgi:TolA-binding protein